MTRGKLYIITGTSAVGKTSIADLVLKKLRNFQRSLTYTTRPPRGQEKNEVAYNFITNELFRKKIKKGEFLEWANNYGNLYGTNKKDILALINRGKNVLVVIDIKGAINIKKNWPAATSIFILPESVKQLEKRFKKRGDTKTTEIKHRLNVARWELGQAYHCDFWVINRENKINQAVREVLDIINSK